jgi:hypothetical protein
MKTQLLWLCSVALVLGSGCATYETGGTADQTGTVFGSGYRESYYADPEHNYVNPHKDYFGARATAPVWKQPPPNGQHWVDPRPEFLWFR